MRALLLLVFSLPAYGVIHGVDDRRETTERGNPSLLLDLAQSSPAIIESKRLIPDGETFKTKGTPLSKIGFCADARFANQTSVARCSASLVGEDLILTAGHCVDDDFKKWCAEYSVVFDFTKDSPIKRQNVFSCKEVIYRNFEMPFGEDLALIRLTKKVPGRTPITISETPVSIGEKLSMIGYPLGIPQKIVDDGKVTAPSDSSVSFQHDLDSFSCNSGGPIFNSKGEQVGVLVRGSGTDFTNPPGRNCYDWGIDSGKDFTEANSLLHLKLPRK